MSSDGMLRAPHPVAKVGESNFCMGVDLTAEVEAAVASALRDARDAAIAEAREHAELVMEEVADPVPSGYGALLVQIRSTARAKLWRAAYIPSADGLDPGPRTSGEQINSVLLRAAEAQAAAEVWQAEQPPSGADVGDVLIHAVRKTEIAANQRFVRDVERITAPVFGSLGAEMAT